MTQFSQNGKITNINLSCTPDESYLRSLQTIRNGDTYIPTQLSKLYKHLQQFKYNIDKPGLDKNIEIINMMNYSMELLFEKKYVFRLIGAIPVNFWRVETSATVTKPWCTRLAICKK